MPLFKTTFFSSQLLENVDMNIYIPDAYSFDYSTLDVALLLHGMCGSENEWIKTGNIIRTADECKIIAVMPRLNNSFGINMVKGYNAEKYIIEEVYEYSHRWLGLNRDKEKNIIAGLSMGGYIALNLGLKYQNLFSHIIALSSPVDVDDLVNVFPHNEITKRIIENAFGNDNLKNSDLSIINQVKKLQVTSKIDLYCGTADHFYNNLKKLSEMLKDKKVNVSFLDDEGGHEWYYWEKYMRIYLKGRKQK